MGNAGPIVSVGLPVYNGENFLRPALESILAQTYSDFEVIVSDNASQDRTQEICESFGAKDPRIRYYRNSTNLGLFKNFNQVFELSKGKYFQWMAHDDLLAPEFLAATVPALDEDDSIVISYAQELTVDAAGEALAIYDYHSRGNSEVPRERFHDVLFVPPVSLSGLIRSEALRKTRLHLEFIGSDWNLALELAMLGRFHEVPERLYLRRSHPQTSIRLFPKHERMTYSCPSKAKQICFPTWRQSYEYFRSVHRFALPSKNKAECYSELLHWMMYPRTKVDLVKDIRLATKKLLLRSRYGERFYRMLRHNGNSMLSLFLSSLCFSAAI